MRLSISTNYSQYGFKSVMDYGAIGDGVTDDTTAILSAISENKNIYFPQGTFLCNLDITAEQFILIGAGSGLTTLKANSADPVIKVDGAEDYIQGWGIKNLTIDGNTSSDGIELYGNAPNVATQGLVESVLIQNADKGIYIHGGGTAEVYANTFNVVQMLNVNHGVYSEDNGTYNAYCNMEICDVNNNGYAIYETGIGNIYSNVKTEGVIKNDGMNNKFYGVTIETISATTPPFSIAFRDAGENSIIDLTLTNVSPSKCSYGYVAYNKNHIILNLKAWGNSSVVPTYLMDLDASTSTGVVLHAETQGTTKAVDYLTSAKMAKWDLLNGNFFDGLKAKVVFAGEPPTTGTWVKGDRFKNNLSVSSDYDGWVCIESGTPGTWKGFGLIES